MSVNSIQVPTCECITIVSVNGLIKISAVSGNWGYLAIGLYPVHQLRASILNGQSVAKVFIHLLQNSGRVRDSQWYLI